jgi:two-component system, NarL family, response regulator LiaR
VLILLLKLVEYRFLVIQHSIEIYGGLIALLFAVLGIWLGLKLTKTRETIIVREVPAPQSFTLNEVRLRELPHQCGPHLY